MKSMSNRAYRWAPADGVGLEHLRISTDPDGITAAGMVIGSSDGVPFALSYRALLFHDWTFHALRIDAVDSSDVVMMSRSPEGMWLVRGRERKALTPCIDIDLSWTPFTNNLPMRRLGLSTGESREIRVAHIEPPDFIPKIAVQRYSCLETGKRFLYEDLTFGTVAEFELQDDGLLGDYPGLFRRIAV